MRKKNKNKYNAVFLVVVSLLAMSSCNVVKHLKPAEQLYTGAEVKVTSAEDLELGQTRKELEKVLWPEPNQTLLGMRIKLWFYYQGEGAEKGLKKWMREKLGERPVLYDPNIPVHVTDILTNRLQNMGYFDAMVKHQVHDNGKKVTITYTAEVSRPYTIAELLWPAPGSDLAKAVNSTSKRSLINRGSRYDLNLFKNERARIDQELKEQGYYYFLHGI